MSSKVQKLLVVAIDLGTDYSVYSFSFLHEYQRDPTKISSPPAFYSGTSYSLKQPTCVLCNPTGQFHSFGYEAENMYSSLSEDEKHHNWYFFRKFKNMQPEKQVNMGFELTDENGLKMPAIKVFAMAIRYWKDVVLNQMDRQGTGLRLDDVHWVLPVPATWTVSAKEFLREAAKEAGIDGANLTIALEPDAAAVYCQLLPSDHLYCGGRFDDDKYMVIALGESTAVFTVHEKQPNGTIKEVHKASGGPWGSTKVNEEFTQMIISIVGGQTFKTFCDDNPEDLECLNREVDLKKYDISTDLNSKYNIKVPYTLNAIYEKNTGKTVKDTVEQTPYKGKIQWTSNKMTLNAELFKSFYKNCISSITSHIENLCQKPGVKGTSTFLMIGKFSECQLVQEAVANAFPKAKVVVPRNPEFAVLNGAVVLGHKCGLTYDCNFQLQQPTNKDHSTAATTLAMRDGDDVSAKDYANGSTCSSSSEKDFRNDQIKNLKYKSLSNEREDALSSDTLEMSVQTQNKNTQVLKTQLENQMTLEAAKRDKADVSSDNNSTRSTGSSCHQRSVRKKRSLTLNYKSLSKEGGDVLSSDSLEMSVQTQNKSTRGLETQVKTQMTLEADNTRAPSKDELFALSVQLDKFYKEWWLLAKLLGLSDKQIDDIEHSGADTHIVRQYYKMLIAWKRHNAGQEKGSVKYLLKQCDVAGIDRKVTDTVFGNKTE